MALSNESILRRISEDRALGASMCFPHRHPQSTPDFHVQIMDLWRCADELVVIEAFRGGAKTTLGEEFLTLEGLFQNFRYLLLIGETYTKACERLDAIKHELLTNMKLASLFGKAKGATWNESQIELKTGAFIQAVGWEQEMRGFKHHDQRPDRAHLDDIETRERVRNTASVDENWRRLFLELWPAMDKMTRKLRMTGTPLADDCMIRRAARSEDWVHGFFPVCDCDPDSPEAVALWPDRYPIEWIRQERDRLAANGLLSAFNQEYMLQAQGAVGKPFTADMIRYEDVAPRVFMPRKLIVDPARTVDVKKSDMTGYVVVSRLGTTLYVHASGGKYWKPDEIVGQTYDMADEHEADAFMEKDSLDEFLMQPMRAEGLRRGRVLNVTAMNAPRETDKVSFILSLQPFFVAGDVVLVGGASKHAQLVAQLLNFPSGKRDTLNALAYSTRIFSGIPVYDDFGQANICRDTEVGRTAALLLGVHCSAAETCAVLVSPSGRRLTVVADWLSPFGPADSVPDIAALVRALYPGRRVLAYVPADAYDQQGRNPLLASLRAQQIQVFRSDTCQLSRGSLSPMIRTELHGRRMLMVDENARNVMNGLASGYTYPSKNGRQLGEPDRNAYRTLIEALECLTGQALAANNEKIASNYAVNPQGYRYQTALPGR